ncbi:nicotinamide N-methyltransferase-like [Pseudophryne corroboree]|uniref:nicotinamide N-methyltransferase-like n=1 Tax=Pseudophryne corroboree TaxID=495146 RepID=UPI003082131D
MSNFTGKEDYQKLFNPKAYLHSYFRFGEGTMGDEFLQFVLKHLADVFTSGKVKGETLIDIGTGPTIYQLLSACEAFKDITVSDFTDKNREEFNLWLMNQPGAFDWSAAGKYVCHLEGDRTTWLEKEARLRKTIKQVLKCDVFNSNPLEPVVLPQADCVLSCLCLEGACSDYEAYVTALKNITKLLKLGGYLVLVGALGNTYYMVGNVKFSGLSLSEVFLKESLIGAGFVIKNFIISNKPAEISEEADFLANYVIAAQKERDV